MKGLLSSDDFDKFMERNATFLTKYREDVEEMKRRKWHRDINDYTANRVYNWTVNFSSGPFRGNKHTNDDSEAFLGVGSPLGTPTNGQDGEAEEGIGRGRTRFQRHNPTMQREMIHKKTNPRKK